MRRAVFCISSSARCVRQRLRDVPADRRLIAFPPRNSRRTAFADHMLPACIASTIIAACRWGGVQMSITSELAVGDQVTEGAVRRRGYDAGAQNRRHGRPLPRPRLLKPIFRRCACRQCMCSSDTKPQPARPTLIFAILGCPPGRDRKNRRSAKRVSKSARTRASPSVFVIHTTIMTRRRHHFCTIEEANATRLTLGGQAVADGLAWLVVGLTPLLLGGCMQATLASSSNAIFTPRTGNYWRTHHMRGSVRKTSAGTSSITHARKCRERSWSIPKNATSITCCLRAWRSAMEWQSARKRWHFSGFAGRPRRGMARLDPDGRNPAAGSAPTRRALPKGPANPLGAPAIYLYTGQQGHALPHPRHRPAGIDRPGDFVRLVRMTNEVVIDLYDRVNPGAIVVVLPPSRAHWWVGQVRVFAAERKRDYAWLVKAGRGFHLPSSHHAESSARAPSSRN